MAEVGNEVSNQFMEANIKGGLEGLDRPSANRTREEANQWIKSKYIGLKYIDLKKFVILQEDGRSGGGEDDGWNESKASESNRKYDVGKGLIKSAREGKVSHVLFHLALAAAIQNYRNVQKATSSNNKDVSLSGHDLDWDFLIEKYDMDFVLSSQVFAAAFEATKSSSVKEVLLLNGYEKD
jgi:hypothetical protein